MEKPIRNFLETAIRSLSKEDFDEAVCIFQKHYLHNEVVNVDGTNDGGSDIKIYKSKREIKKCVQVTINKSIEIKLKADLVKVNKKINDYGYSNYFDFFCNTAISEAKVDEYKQYALEKYDIILNIYESRRLSQLECKEFAEYVYSLHKDVVIRPQDLTIDKATKVLYDMLANGKDSADIKNSLYQSVLLSVLYEHISMSEDELKKEVESRLKKELPGFHSIVSSLRVNETIISDVTTKGNICLNPIESDSIKDIVATSLQQEKVFTHSVAEILGVPDNEDVVSQVIELLKRLYRQYYKIDIDESSDIKNTEKRRTAIFEEFSKALTKLLQDEDNLSYIEKIRILCTDNTYINRIAASESVLSLYHSDRLSSYLNQKEKRIYLDTPSFIYLLCGFFYGLNVKYDWNDPLYISMKSLMKQQNVSRGRISFYIMSSYLAEVANELKKALQISWLEDCPFASNLGQTTNTFYNYYRYMKDNKLFEENEDIESFEDFVYKIGFDDLDANDSSFSIKTIRTLNQLAEDYNVSVEPYRQLDKFSETRDTYEKLLYLKKKTKTRAAANKDVEQTLFLLLRDQYVNYADNTDWFFTTWDGSIVLLRNMLLDEDSSCNYKYYTIANPAQLSNRFAIENFDIDNSAITNDIFIYADKNFDILKKVQDLIDLIAPILGNKDVMNHKLIVGLSRIRKEQLDAGGIDVNDKSSKNLPIEEALIYLMPKQIEKDYKEKMIQFSAFMNSEENTDYILKTMENVVESLTKHVDYDLTEFHTKIYDIHDVTDVCENSI